MKLTLKKDRKMRVNVTKLRNRDNYLIALVIGLFILAAMHTLLTYLCMGVFAILFVIINVRCVGTKDIFIAKLVVILLLFQNFAIGIGGHIGGNMNDSLSLLTQVPFMFVAIAYILVLTRTFEKLEKVDIFFFIYVILCIAFFFVGEGAIMAKLVYFRNFCK